jgi:CBS domain-containing protein
MRPKVVSCTLRTPVMEVARRMQDESVRAVVVASSGSDLIAGIVTELDLLRAVVSGKTEGMASDVMTLVSVPSINLDQPLDAAVDRMLAEDLAMLIVTGGEPARPVGTLSTGDIATLLAR